MEGNYPGEGELLPLQEGQGMFLVSEGIQVYKKVQGQVIARLGAQIQGLTVTLQALWTPLGHRTPLMVETLVGHEILQEYWKHLGHWTCGAALPGQVTHLEAVAGQLHFEP